MTYRCVILESADSDRDSIVSYLIETTGSTLAAGQLIESINQLVAKLVEYPTLFALSRTPELADKGYRVAPVGCYIVLYTFAKKTVYIEHIFHQRQDYAHLV